MAIQKFVKKRSTKSIFELFKPYEGGRIRHLRYDFNALADFEQLVGMGFAQLMNMKAVFATTRAMLYAGLKHEDPGLTIEYVGELLGQFLQDGHTVDEGLTAAFEAAISQGVLGKKKVEEEADVEILDPTARPTTGEKEKNLPYIDLAPIPPAQSVPEPTPESVPDAEKEDLQT